MRSIEPAGIQKGNGRWIGLVGAVFSAGRIHGGGANNHTEGGQ